MTTNQDESETVVGGGGSKGWESLSDDIKRSEIVQALELNEAGLVEPRITNRYIEAQIQLTDQADRMRLDLEWWGFLDRLRSEGRISTREELFEQADGMVHMSSDEMRKALHERASEFREKHDL